MEKRFDINQALRVYDKVVSNGIKRHEKYHYQGICAWSAVDGYTVQLSDEKVTLSLYFHSKYEFDYKNSRQLNEFIKKIDGLDKRN